MKNDTRQQWEAFLNPDVLRPQLISAAIFIAGFESLKDAIVSRIRDFFLTGFDKDGPRIDPEYALKVLSRKKSATYASLDWLKSEMHAIDGSDIAMFDRVRECRNRLSHELLSMLASDGLPTDIQIRFNEMVELLHKIERWWIVNVELPTNPDFDDEEIDYDGITCGRVMGLQLLCDIALGDSETSSIYYEHFRQRPNASQ